MADFRAGQILTAAALNNSTVTPAIDLIEQIALSNAGRVEFIDIPQEYRNLRVEWSGWHTGTGTDSPPRAVLLRFNDDSASNYFTYLRAFVADETTTHDAANPGSTSRIGFVGGENQNRSAGTIHIPAYATTGNDKAAFGTGYALGGSALAEMADFMAGTMWNVSEQAVTKVALFVSGGGFSFRAGSTFSLYGLR